MAERAREQQELLFPEYAPQWLWHRKTHNGYCTLPRTLPLAMQAIDMNSKGQPAGHTLFCLWARSPDQALVTIEYPPTFAAEAGFQGERAVDTWRRRMKKLKELRFIEARPGPSGDYHYVLLMNPNVALEWMNKEGLLQEGLYIRFKGRISEIGATRDIEDIEQLWADEEVGDSGTKGQNPPEAGDDLDDLLK